MDYLKRERILTECKDYVIDICAHHGIGADHGYSHAKRVSEIAELAFDEFNLTEDERVFVKVACLLHDMDDKKFFKSHEFPHAKSFIDKYPELPNCIMTMIEIVSFSTNGNNVDPTLPRWYYLPRDADRISCAGFDGVKRIVQYNMSIRRPLISSTNEIVISLDQLRQQCNHSAETNYCSIIQFYKTNWFKRSFAASGSEVLTSLIKKEFEILEQWMLAFCLTLKKIAEDCRTACVLDHAYNYQMALDVVNRLQSEEPSPLR